MVPILTQRELIVPYIKYEHSHWAQHRVNLGAPWQEHPDPIIDIPESGALRPLQENCGDENFRMAIPELTRYKVVVIQYGDVSGVSDQYTFRLLWIDERREWIVIVEREWIEGAGLSDMDVSGPFALNTATAQKILEAFGLPSNALSPSEVSTSSPEKLTKLAKTSILK